MTDRIHTEISDYTVTLSIHTTSGISTIDLDPSAAYALAQYIEWLTEPTPPEGVRRVAPSLAAPAGTGVWGEFKPGAKVASVVHITVISDDDDEGFGRSIALSPPVAANLGNQLIAKAVYVADVEVDDEEETSDD